MPWYYSGSYIPNGSITTEKIANQAITLEKINNSSFNFDYSSTYLSQTNQNDQGAFLSTRLRYGQRINNFSGYIHKFTLKFKKTASASGTLVGRIRKVLNDSIIATSDNTIDISSLPENTFQDVTFTFSNTIYIPTQTDIRILGEVSNLNNIVYIGLYNVDLPNQNACYFESSYTEMGHEAYYIIDGRKKIITKDL